MRASAVAGIIFANSHDEVLEALTKKRSMASVPFGARYRLVDFSLSNFVNAGITNVAIITKNNYRSLMDHVGSGIYWDLDRKNGGIRILSPFITSSARRYNGYVEALYNSRDFIERSNAEHIILTDGCVVGNIDLSEAVEYHCKKEADVTLLYKTLENYTNKTQAMTFECNSDGRIISADFPETVEGSAATSFGVMIFRREKLTELLKTAYENGSRNIEEDMIAANLKELKAYGFEHTGFAAIMDSKESYYSANMALLNEKVRRELFPPERPIYTKTRDDMPTRYGIDASVTNSVIAEGCVIEGTVKNSVLFRGVKVKKGAVVENCILMQDAVIGENACVEYSVFDKNAELGAEISLKGTKENYVFAEKNKRI